MIVGRVFWQTVSQIFSPTSHTHTRLVVTESNKHVGVRPTLMFSPSLVSPPLFHSVQLIKKGNQLSLCKRDNSRREGKDWRMKSWNAVATEGEKTINGHVFLHPFFVKELLMTDSRAENMPMRPKNFARSENPYFHTHNDYCTTQQNAEMDPPVSKALLSNNRLNGNTNWNVSKRDSCDLHVTLFFKYKMQTPVSWALPTQTMRVVHLQPLVYH